MSAGVILLHGPTGTAFKLEADGPGRVVLVCAPINADGTIERADKCDECRGTGTREDRDSGAPMQCVLCDGTGREGGGDGFNWGEVDFSRGLDEDQARECRAIETALLELTRTSALLAVQS